MKHIRHQRLEPHVLHARDHLRTLKVPIRTVPAALAQVIHEVFCDLAERAALLAEIDYDADARALRASDAFEDRVGQVWLAGADVGPEDVGAVACV